MIASLLPGLRELRTPLAAGYMWLLFAWILVEPSLPSPREELTGVAGSISRLIDEGSVVALGAVISFAAYLVGTVYVGLLRAPRLAYRWYAARRRGSQESFDNRTWTLVLTTVLSVRGVAALTEFAARTLATQTKRAKALGKDDQTVKKFFAENGLLFKDDIFGLFALFGPSMHIALREFDLLKLRLLRKSPELFAEVDRGFAEAEFRLAIAPPLAALAALLALEDSPLWAIAMLAVPALIAQGIARRRAAGDRLVDALVLDEIKSPLLEGLERTIDEALAAKNAAVTVAAEP
jgi:hypothetical protein